MKQIYLTLFFFFFSLFINAQQKIVKKSYVKYSDYKAMKENSESHFDSIGFKIINNDSLVEITPMDTKGSVAVPYEYKDSLFLKQYKMLVYNKDNQKITSTKKAMMKYWKSEIKVYFDSTVTNLNRRELTKFFKFLDKEIDSLKIAVVNNKSKSNYFIYFINKPDDINWDERIYSKTDGYYLSWDGKQRIYNCTLKLDTQKIYNEKQQITALKKQFLFSLGNFYAMQDRDCKSYFSTCFSIDKELTSEDLELLKYHYSYGICKGTDLETFENNHKKAQEELKKNPNNRMKFIQRE